MGLPLFIEPEAGLQTAQGQPPVVVDRSCLHLVGLRWAMRWYDPWASLHQTIATCLGHDGFTYWGCWIPWEAGRGGRGGRGGICKVIVRSDYPRIQFSQQDVASLSQPYDPDSIIRRERCSAQPLSCSIRDLWEPLQEIELALLQEGAFRLGEQSLHSHLAAQLLSYAS